MVYTIIVRVYREQNEEINMLIQFNFKNFKSFRDEVSLDLSATKITEHEDHVVDIANDKLLKVAAIYGANASGKSNVYDAFDYMTYYVAESWVFCFFCLKNPKKKNE